MKKQEMEVIDEEWGRWKFWRGVKLMREKKVLDMCIEKRENLGEIRGNFNVEKKEWDWGVEDFKRERKK